jgi:predicted secreted hydrolase
VPSRQLELELNAVLDTQEWTGDLRYWEGAVVAHAPGGPSGRGYLELTGYLP